MAVFLKNCSLNSLITQDVLCMPKVFEIYYRPKQLWSFLWIPFGCVQIWIYAGLLHRKKDLLSTATRTRYGVKHWHGSAREESSLCCCRFARGAQEELRCLLLPVGRCAGWVSFLHPSQLRAFLGHVVCECLDCGALGELLLPWRLGADSGTDAHPLPLQGRGWSAPGQPDSRLSS